MRCKSGGRCQTDQETCCEERPLFRITRIGTKPDQQPNEKSYTKIARKRPCVDNNRKSVSMRETEASHRLEIQRYPVRKVVVDTVDDESRNSKYPKVRH